MKKPTSFHEAFKRLMRQKSFALAEIRFARLLSDQESRRILIQDYFNERNYIIENYYQEQYGYFLNNSSMLNGDY